MWGNEEFYMQSSCAILNHTRNTFYRTRYLSHCNARFAFNPLFVIWVTSLTHRVTWCHRSRDHWNRRWSFPIGGLLMPSHYLAWLPRYWASNISGHDLDPFQSHDVIGHVTIRTTDGPFLLVIRWQCPYLAPLPRYWASNISDYDLDPFGSHDVLCHVTIGTAVGHFLLVTCWHHVPILHRCRDIEHQTFWGPDLDPFGLRDVIGHMTIGTTDGRFLLVIHWHHVPISHRCRDIKHHNLDNHISIVNTLENNFGDFWGLG